MFSPVWPYRGPKPMNRLIKNTFKHEFPDILTWIGEFRPGNKTIYVVFDEESGCLDPRMYIIPSSKPSLLGKTYPIELIFTR